MILHSLASPFLFLLLAAAAMASSAPYFNGSRSAAALNSFSLGPSTLRPSVSGSSFSSAPAPSGHAFTTSVLAATEAVSSAPGSWWNTYYLSTTARAKASAIPGTLSARRITASSSSVPGSSILKSVTAYSAASSTAKLESSSSAPHQIPGSYSHGQASSSSISVRVSSSVSSASLRSVPPRSSSSANTELSVTISTSALSSRSVQYASISAAPVTSGSPRTSFSSHPAYTSTRVSSYEPTRSSHNSPAATVVRSSAISSFSDHSRISRQSTSISSFGFSSETPTALSRLAVSTTHKGLTTRSKLEASRTGGAGKILSSGSQGSSGLTLSSHYVTGNGYKSFTWGSDVPTQSVSAKTPAPTQAGFASGINTGNSVSLSPSQIPSASSMNADSVSFVPSYQTKSPSKAPVTAKYGFSSTVIQTTDARHPVDSVSSASTAILTASKLSSAVGSSSTSARSNWMQSSRAYTPDITVVSTYTTYCATPTTFTYRNQTVDVSTPSVVTVTDCPCTLSRVSSTGSWSLISAPPSTRTSHLSSVLAQTSAPRSLESGSDLTTTTTISQTLATFVTKTVTSSPSGLQSALNPLVSGTPYPSTQLPLTTTVSVLTTYCSAPTTFTVHSTAYSITTPSTLVISNCVLTRASGSTARWQVVTDSTPNSQGLSTAFQVSYTASSTQTGFTQTRPPFATFPSAPVSTSVSPDLLSSTASESAYATPSTVTYAETPSLSTSLVAKTSETESVHSTVHDTHATSSYTNTGLERTTTQGTVTGSNPSQFSAPTGVGPQTQQISSNAFTVVSSFTTYCPTPTTFTFNSKTYTASGPSTLTITECPCTLDRPISSTVRTPTSSVKSESGVSSSETSSSVFGSDVTSSTGAPPPRATVFTTYCPSPTTFTVGSNVYTATGPSTFTITSTSSTISQPTSVTSHTDSSVLTEQGSTGSKTAYSVLPSTSLAVFTTFCPSATTFTVGSQVYKATGPSSFTITTSALSNTAKRESPTQVSDVSSVWQSSASVRITTRACSGPTTLTYDSKTYTLGPSSAITLTESVTEEPYTGELTALSTNHPSSPSLVTEISRTSSPATSVVPLHSPTSAASPASEHITYLPGPTTLTTNGKTYVASSATTLTLPANLVTLSGVTLSGTPAPDNGGKVSDISPARRSSSAWQETASDTSITTVASPDGTTTIASVIRTRTVTQHSSSNAPELASSIGTGTSSVALNNRGNRISASGLLSVTSLILICLV